ncbi:MAG: hypothetical protein R3B99_36450 [Polyangiales bacterium]
MDEGQPPDPPDDRPSFELPLPPGMKPLEEPSRARSAEPMHEPSPPPRAVPALPPQPVAPNELELEAPHDLPGLELEPVSRPRRAPSVAPSAAPEAEPPSASAQEPPHVRAMAWARAHPRVVVLVVLTLLALWHAWEPSERWPRGVALNDEPEQETIESPQVHAFGDYHLVPRATYRLRARVLSRERYHLGRESELSSYDLALGWGVMSRQEVLDALDIRQGSRRYRYSWSGQDPAEPRTMARQSANHHILAGSEEVADLVADVPVGGALELEGELVAVESPDGWHWDTSLSRLDVGDGACEIFHVRRARRVPLSELVGR